MDKENNIVYVENKNGIFKCYKSEQMHMPIYYPIENKTNGFIDYNDVIRILNIDDLYEKVKKQREVIDKAKEYISNKVNNHIKNKLQKSDAYEMGLKNSSYKDRLYSETYIELQIVLNILKEVSE